MTTPTWRPHPIITDYACDILASDEHVAQDRCLAMIEDFGKTDFVYPCAINAATGNLERGGPMHPDRARAWAERVAGLHPSQAGDERPPFYYAAEPQP